MKFIGRKIARSYWVRADIEKVIINVTRSYDHHDVLTQVLNPLNPVAQNRFTIISGVGSEIQSDKN